MKENVFLIYNGVDTESFSRPADEAEKNALKDNLGFEKFPIIGSISRLSPVKGLTYLFFAMKDILRRMPEAHLLLVGEGPAKERLMELAKKLGIETNIFFALSTTQTKRFLTIIDVFVFYSLEEGLGLSLLEAMASGLPFVATDGGGPVRDVVSPKQQEYVVPAGDIEGFSQKVVDLLSNDKERDVLAKEGLSHVKKYSLGEIVNIFLREIIT